MRQALVFGLAATLIACGGTTEQASSGSGGGAASGSSSATTGSSDSTGSASTGSTTTSSSGAGGGSSACAGAAKGPGDYDESLQDATGMRTFHVHVPKSVTGQSPVSLVLVFHGFTETSAGIEDISQMTPVSDAHGFIVVYPQGLDTSWNAGSCCGNSSTNKVDDVQFVKDLLDKLESEYCVDPRRIFSSGFSNGGMLSHRLACELSDRIAAIGAVSGTLAIPSCTPARPVPVMHVHGTGDIVVAYDNGGISGAMGVPPTISTWTMIDKCADAMPTNVYMQGDASCNEYQMCAPGTAVRLCTIDQGGHQWPGGHDDFIGKLSKDLNASEEIAKFFEAHPMP